jgi:hypothetical protein
VTPTNSLKRSLASFKKRCSLCDVWCDPIGGVYARRARLRHCDTNSKNVLLRVPDLIDRPAFVRSSQSSKHLRLLFELRVKQVKSRPISRVSVLTFLGSKLLLVDYAVLTSITREVRAQTFQVVLNCSAGHVWHELRKRARMHDHEPIGSRTDGPSNWQCDVHMGGRRKSRTLHKWRRHFRFSELNLATIFISL